MLRTKWSEIMKFLLSYLCNFFSSQFVESFKRLIQAPSKKSQFKMENLSESLELSLHALEVKEEPSEVPSFNDEENVSMAKRNLDNNAFEFTPHMQEENKIDKQATGSNSLQMTDSEMMPLIRGRPKSQTKSRGRSKSRSRSRGGRKASKTRSKSRASSSQGPKKGKSVRGRSQSKKR